MVEIYSFGDFPIKLNLKLRFKKLNKESTPMFF